MSRTFGVIGGRFGVYGYLPAILRKYPYVNLSKKHKIFINSRKDLAQYYSQIKWLASDLDVISTSSIVVFAVPPAAQRKIILENLEILQNKYLILEKPTAENPHISASLLSNLHKAEINFSINYTFLLTKWFAFLKECRFLDHSYRVHIRWNFLAYYFKKDLSLWKKYHSQGGGCLRFFSIHLIAVFSELGFTDIQSSELFFVNEDVPYKWVSVLKNNTSSVNVCVDSSSPTALFEISIQREGENIFFKSMLDPFDENENNFFDDVRSFYISKLIDRIEKEKNDFSLLNSYIKINNFWEKIESSTKSTKSSKDYK